MCLSHPLVDRFIREKEREKKRERERGKETEREIEGLKRQNIVWHKSM